MIRCPNCNSRKYRGNEHQKHCENCGFLWKNALYHKTTSMSDSRYGGDKVVISPRTTEQNASVCQIDYHNVAYKFNVKKDNPDVHLPIKIPMNNWIQEQEENENVTIQRNPKTVVFFLKRRIKTTLDEGDKALSEARELIIKEAISYQERYNLLLDLESISPVRKEVKVMSPFVSAGTLFRGKLAKSVYPTGQVEFIDKDKAMEHAKNFVENMSIENKADKIIEAMEVFGKGMEQHMALIQELQNTARTIQTTYKPFWMIAKERVLSWIGRRQ